MSDEIHLLNISLHNITFYPSLPHGKPQLDNLLINKRQRAVELITSDTENYLDQLSNSVKEIIITGELDTWISLLIGMVIENYYTKKKKSIVISYNGKICAKVRINSAISKDITY